MGFNEKIEILNDLDEKLYITKKEDNTLVFISNNLKKQLNLDSSSLGKKCYDVFGIGKSQCDFCKFGFPKDCFYVKKRFSNIFNRLYLNRGKEIEIDGVKYNLVIVEDITEQEKKDIELSRVREVQSINYEFVSALTSQKESLDEAINELLMRVCDYYKADRGYVFLIDYEENVLNNIYEYVIDGVTPEIDNLQNVPIQAIDRWLTLFEEEGMIYIDSIDNELKKDSLEYKILKQQNIDRLLALPFFIDGNVVGFVGIDNPRYDYNDIAMLSAASFFIYYDLSKRVLIKKLKNLSFYDMLTGLKNRNNYIDVIETYEKAKIRSIGIVFIDLNGLKKANDEFGHEYGDRMLKATSSLLKDVFRDNAYRIGGDEFVVLIKNPKEEEFNLLVDKFDKAIKRNEKINLSYGTIYQRNPKDIETLVSQADSRMYEQKKKHYKNGE